MLILAFLELAMYSLILQYFRRTKTLKKDDYDIYFMASKVPAAQNRLFKNAFVCKVCKHKMRLESLKILSGKARCRKCKSGDFRTIRKK